VLGLLPRTAQGEIVHDEITSVEHLEDQRYETLVLAVLRLRCEAASPPASRQRA